ncbi:dynein heavy chain 6, axonemal [Lates japonicus]|uniref:Dynein heavy chain 6, axonemal n=1 Tax=Lates japonicus TaxID=270547 RepID=A0AAD3MWH5_LATJO|nr:dynein heavy chain 6, axonemal [Lates japonicus]
MPLITLQKAIAGLVVMSGGDGSHSYKRFLNNQVSTHWANSAYPSQTWFLGQGPVLRTSFIQILQKNMMKCVFLGPPLALWPVGVLQNYGHHNLPIDELNFRFNMVLADTGTSKQFRGSANSAQQC